jgi:hypothetical protein
MQNILELRTALKAAQYQLSRSREGSLQRMVLLSLIADYTLALSVLSSQERAA